MRQGAAVSKPPKQARKEYLSCGSDFGVQFVEFALRQDAVVVVHSPPASWAITQCISYGLVLAPGAHQGLLSRGANLLPPMSYFLGARLCCFWNSYISRSW